MRHNHESYSAYEYQGIIAHPIPFHHRILGSTRARSGSWVSSSRKGYRSKASTSQWIPLMTHRMRQKLAGIRRRLFRILRKRRIDHLEAEQNLAQQLRQEVCHARADCSPWSTEEKSLRRQTSRVHLMQGSVPTTRLCCRMSTSSSLCSLVHLRRLLALSMRIRHTKARFCRSLLAFVPPSTMCGLLMFRVSTAQRTATVLRSPSWS